MVQQHLRGRTAEAAESTWWRGPFEESPSVRKALSVSCNEARRVAIWGRENSWQRAGRRTVCNPRTVNDTEM